MFPRAMIMIAAALVHSLAVVGGSSSCFSNLTAGVHHRINCSLLLKGMTLTYNVPKQCAAGMNCGLILDVHGLWMDALMEDRGTNMRAIGERHGYIVVQPTAPSRFGGPLLPNWNLPLSCQGHDECPGDAAMNGVLQQALAVKSWSVDPARTHFMGFSEGAMMACRIVCHYPSAFASVAVMEGVGCSPPPLECLNATSPQVPMLVQSGWNDWGCGSHPGIASHGGQMSDPPMQYVSKIWGLDSGRIIAGDNVTWLHTRYLGRTGVPLDFYNFSYVADYPLKGHCFPGANDSFFGCPGRKERAQGQVAGYHIGEEAMNFFLANPRREG